MGGGAAVAVEPHESDSVCPVAYRREAELKAGLSALADYSTLAAPTQRTIAFPEVGWEGVSRRKDVVVLPLPDTDALTVEVWTYLPSLGLRPGLVDTLFLYCHWSLPPTSAWSKRFSQCLRALPVNEMDLFPTHFQAFTYRFALIGGRLLSAVHERGH